jgi:hypothetical protein
MTPGRGGAAEIPVAGLYLIRGRKCERQWLFSWKNAGKFANSLALGGKKAPGGAFLLKNIKNC